MNIFNFNGDFNRNFIKGKNSKAAKAAFKDILEDPDMKVTIQVGDFQTKINTILTEEKVILEEEVLEFIEL